MESQTDIRKPNINNLSKDNEARKKKIIRNTILIASYFISNYYYYNRYCL